MYNTVSFLEHFMKQSIIDRFADKLMLEEGFDLKPVNISEPILTLCDYEEESKKFALTNVGYWNHEKLHGDMYNIDGVIDHKGRIFIMNYEIQNN